MTIIEINDLDGEFELGIRDLKEVVGGHAGVNRQKVSTRPWATVRRCCYFNRQRHPADQDYDTGIYLGYGKGDLNRSNDSRFRREALLDSLERDDWRFE
jgi:hypothetical protein